MYEVTVHPSVAFSRLDGGGTRRRRLADGTVLEFSRVPVRLAAIPPEVAADKLLVVRKVGRAASAAVEESTEPANQADAPTGDPDTDKKGDRVQITNAPPAGDGTPIVDVDLSELKYTELVKMAHELGIDASGKQDALRTRLRNRIVSTHVADPAAISTTPPQE